MGQTSLRRAGDRVVVTNERASSWADGTRVLLGEDSIDFVIVLGDLATSSGARNLTVRHVPPAQPKMKIPVKAGERRYVASIGKETFDAEIRLSPATGKIVSARLENPVEVFERECSDEALTACGEGVRYQILRRIEIREIS